MAKFMARCSNQVLTMIPQRQRVESGLVITDPGKHIHFENGIYETEDEKEIAFLRKHKFFGTRIAEVPDKATGKSRAVRDGVGTAGE